MRRPTLLGEMLTLAAIVVAATVLSYTSMHSTHTQTVAKPAAQEYQRVGLAPGQNKEETTRTWE